ncbi:uncharacterized protein [Nicotiana tomentosiformis]|uniref:uncharacterized protein n=1 Tax=Nicotiana tomentosiformis TaxID=4098 RepID=UPI00388C58A2
MGSLAFIAAEEIPLALDIQCLANKLVILDISEPSRLCECVVAQSSLFERIKDRQYDDPHLLVIRETHVKCEHHRPGGLLQQMVMLGWKWENITMNFVVGFPWTLRNFDAVWVIVDRLTKSAHLILVVTMYSSRRLGQIYIQEIVRLHGLPVSYHWLSFRTITVIIRALRWLFLKIYTECKKVKLRPTYIKLFEILEKIGEVAYKLAFPPSLSVVHLVFHVSVLWKYYVDPSHIIDFCTVQLDEDLTYIEKHVAILD